MIAHGANGGRTVADRSRQHGGVLAIAVHVVLLLAVLAQVVYLASRYRVRVDLTSDKVWTSTESTKLLLDRLDKRLLIEAYFSPKETLPVAYRETRVWADNFLDEIVQLGRGKVVLQRLDPNSDKAIADKATRVGIQPQNLRSQSATSLSLDQHWQGLRLVYGGGRQEVLPTFLPPNSFAAEALLTPKIKDVLTETRRKFGYMEWPVQAMGGRQPSGTGWNVVRTHEGIKKRYDFQNLKDEDGALLPDDVGTLFLFRPKDLTDRQKYVLDQFVVGGGTLVVFADAAEYAIGEQRMFSKIPMALDASGSEHPFARQLEHYGLDWRPQLLADMAQPAQAALDPLRQPSENYAVVQQNAMGYRQAVPVAYPYFFHAVHTRWADVADQLARDPEGQVDEALAKRYRETFVPGMPADDFLFQVFHKLNRGPGFYWPTWVGLRQRAGGAVDLPEGVAGRVLLWSSPAVLVEEPPQNLDPVGRDPRQMRQTLDAFVQKLNERMRAEPRQQAPLMVEVKGRFTSFFAGKDRPKRPSEIKEEEARREADAAAAAAAAAGETPPKPDEQPDQPAEPAAGPEPPPADTKPDATPPERAMRTAAEKPGRIVMIGDATFLQDDVIRGDYAQIGGPFSGQLAMPFFAQLLDWLSEDQDLVALQSRAPADRTLKLVEPPTSPNADPRLAEQTLRRKTQWLLALNIVLPCALLALFGAVVLLVRRSQKRAFLASLR